LTQEDNTAQGDAQTPAGCFLVDRFAGKRLNTENTEETEKTEKKEPTE
jgi:hypothetical protein